MTAKTIKAFGDWRNNADMIADVAQLGYLDGRVMDVTWGEGNFWTVFKPRRLVKHDLYTLDGVDATLPLPHRALSFNAIVIDMPYAFRGRASEDFDAKYGVGEYTSAQDIMNRIFAAMFQANTVLDHGGYLLVKCQDQVVSGNVRWQTDEVRDYAVKQLRMRKVDRFDLPSGGRPQPDDRTKKCPTCKGTGEVGHDQYVGECFDCNGVGRVLSKQQHAAYRPSTLLVFRKRKAPLSR